MSYASQADLLARTSNDELLEVTDRADPPAGMIDATVIAAALADAESEINGYIAVRITMPVAAPVPTMLTQVTCAVARYRLWKDRASEKVSQDYRDAIAWAKGVGAGTIALGDTTTATAPPSMGAPQVCAPERIFTRRSLRDD